MTIVEMARAHVNNVAGQLQNMTAQRDKLNEEIAQVQQFLHHANEEVAAAEQGDENGGREVSSKDVNANEGEQE